MGRTHATIVCIDDSEEMGLIVEKFLVGAGYYVLKASSGREGVNLVIREKPSLVLMDIMMPDMDGFEACSLLQQDPSTSHIPVVFITASESEEDRVRAFAVGGVDFLIKPVKKTDLLSKVETLLAGQNRWAEITSTTLSPVRSGLSRFREFRQHLATRLTLSPEQADEAQGLAPGGIYSGLASLGVAEDQTARLMAQFLRLPFLTSLDTAEIRLGVLPTSFCRQNMVVPVHLVDSGNGIVVTNPFDREVMDLLADLPPESRGSLFAVTDPRNVRLLFSTGTREHQTLTLPEENVHSTPSVDELLRELDKERIDAAPNLDDGERILVTENDSTVVRLVNQIITDAHRRQVSDVHVEPALENDVLVRYRVDGRLQRAFEIPWKYRTAVPSRLKIMAGLDIAEKRQPQSGKISMRKWSRLDLELRVETVPTVAGSEDVVLRLLSSSEALGLDQLGLSKANQLTLERILNEPYGLILCVGPTGSGKTTTLHAALRKCNREDVKILTAEDPVEITQPGLRQIQVNPKAGRTFASVLRSFLRADPDIIMVGEMRDRETATIAVEASLTGHLVFSTLHTNNAPETLVRLVNMGLDPFSFADSLLGVLAQRLLRTLCPACRREATLSQSSWQRLAEEYADEDGFLALGIGPGAAVNLPSKEGCEACRGTGFRGRMAVHELLAATDEVRSLVARGVPVAELRAQAVADGMRTLKQDGIEKVLAGFTTLDEVRAVSSR